MKSLTDNAQNRLDKYISEVRTFLQTCTNIDADEVQRDISEHIEAELMGLSEPVSLKDLEVVLDRLGNPSQWVPDEAVSWWRKIILRLRTGPEDFRLAYISFGLLLLTFLFPPFFLFSFLLARVCVYEASSREEELGAQKWLIYPPLLLVYVPISVLVLSWPLAGPYAFLSYGDYALQLLGLPAETSTELLTLVLAIFSTGIWWFILGVLLLICPELLAFLVRPFADKHSHQCAKTLLWTGLVMAMMCATTGTIFVWWAIRNTGS